MAGNNKTANRRASLKTILEKKFEGAIADMARAIERDDAYVWQLLNDGSFGERIAGYIEERLGLDPHTLERGPNAGTPDEIFPGTPVVGTAQLGDDGFWHELQYPVGAGEGYVRYPARDPNTYALRLKGDSMRPRIKPGEFVVLEPNRAVHTGDEVMVQTTDGRSMVKQLGARREGLVELLSINEQDHRPITLDEREIEKMHYVGGILKASLYYEKSY